jgi:predicted DNA binding CopG/RHH family protein
MTKKVTKKSDAIRRSASFKAWADKWKLDEDEQEVLAAFEAGELKLAPNQKKLKAEAEAAARNFFRKNARLNIRISNHDLLGLKKKAAVEGLPYQTLAASVIHKYVHGTAI